MDELKELYIHKYKITTKVRSEIGFDDYKGSALRSLFGQILCKKNCKYCKDCCEKDECYKKGCSRTIGLQGDRNKTEIEPACDSKKKPVCYTCNNQDECIFSKIIIAPQGCLPSQYKTPPKPYVIVPPISENPDYAVGEILCFHIVLIGFANRMLRKQLVDIVNEMGKNGLGEKVQGGKRGSFELERIEACSKDGSLEEIFPSQNNMEATEKTISFADFLSEEIESRSIKLIFDIPADIKLRKDKSQEINDNESHRIFESFINALYARAQLLSARYCGGHNTSLGNKIEVSDLIKIEDGNILNKKIGEKRYHDKEPNYFKGFMGSMICKGDLSKFMPLLKFGENIHVGKNAVSGLGKFRVERFN